MATPTISIPTPEALTTTNPQYSYVGYRTAQGTTVLVRREKPGGPYPRSIDLLPLRLDLRDHSPSGFEWGYGGSGPAQLALALLAHHTGDDAYACAMYQHFKWNVICALPEQRWEMNAVQLRDWVVRHPMEPTPGHPLE